MNRIIRYGNGIIQYSVVESKRRKKTCEIIVGRDGVVIRTPLGKPAYEIKRIVEEKRRWIFKKQLEFNGHDPQKPSPRAYSRRFITGRTYFLCFKSRGISAKNQYQEAQKQVGQCNQRQCNQPQ